jgi:hypothetical protein
MCSPFLLMHIWELSIHSLKALIRTSREIDHTKSFTCTNYSSSASSCLSVRRFSINVNEKNQRNQIEAFAKAMAFEYLYRNPSDMRIDIAHVNVNQSSQHLSLSLIRNHVMFWFNVGKITSQKYCLLKSYVSDSNSMPWSPSTPQQIVTIGFWESIFLSIQSSTSTRAKDYIVSGELQS